MKYKSVCMLPLVAGLMLGAGSLASAEEVTDQVTIKVTDIPGHWFDTGVTIPGTGTRSLAIVRPGTTIKFQQKNDDDTFVAESRHTVTSLIWPSDAKPAEQIDQPAANQDN